MSGLADRTWHVFIDAVRFVCSHLGLAQPPGTIVGASPRPEERNAASITQAPGGNRSLTELYAQVKLQLLEGDKLLAGQSSDPLTCHIGKANAASLL
jgi:hypothetical protein